MSKPSIAPRVDQIRWTLAQPGPPAESAPAPPDPPAMTGSRSDLVAWWRWRYATLEADCLRLKHLLVEVLVEAQSYREVAQAAGDHMHELTETIARQKSAIVHLRDQVRQERDQVAQISRDPHRAPREPLTVSV